MSRSVSDDETLLRVRLFFRIMSKKTEAIETTSLLRELLDESPFSPPVLVPEKETTTDEQRKKKKKDEEEQTLRYSLLDLLYAIWNLACPAGRNLRLILTTVSKYATRQTKEDPTSARLNEANTLKRMLVDLYDAWAREKSIQMDKKISTIEMNKLVRSSVSKCPSLCSLYEDFIEEDSFYRWISDHKSHVESVSRATSRESSPPLLLLRNEEKRKRGDDDDNDDDDDDDDYDNNNNDNDDDDEATKLRKRRNALLKKKRGLDSLKKKRGLDSLLDDNDDSVELSETDPIFRQNVTTLKHGRLCMLKTPGERGSQLVRLQLFDTEDIANKNMQIWWKFAKVRTQFLISSSDDDDRKGHLLRKLLDTVTDDMREVSGTTRDVKTIHD